MPRSKAALGYTQVMPNDNKLYNVEQLADRMCLMLGGRAAEMVTFNRVSTGAQDDLQKVTGLAYRQVAEFGMNSSIGLLAYDQPSPQEGKRNHSDATQQRIDHEVGFVLH